MKRLRMRPVVCSLVAGVCLCAAVLVQAGPMGFVKRMWKERPVVLKTKESRLNPINWFRRGEDDSSDRRIASGDSQKIERPELVSDPFLSDTAVADAISPEPEIKEAAPYREPAVERAETRAPRAVERNVAASRTPNPPAASLGAAVQTPTPNRSQQPAALSGPKPRNEIADGAAPRLPDLAGLESAGQRPAPRRPQPSTPRRPVPQQPQPSRPAQASPGGNQFVGGFDAEFAKLVQSVVAETEQESISAPARDCRHSPQTRLRPGH